MKDVRERLIKIEATLEHFKSLFASKADLFDARTQIILWVVGTVILAQVIPPLMKKFGIG